jgi:hypothetical protein
VESSTTTAPPNRLRATKRRFSAFGDDERGISGPLLNAGTLRSSLALVIRNLGEVSALQESLREVGAQQVLSGARPQDYFVVRDALVRAIRSASTSWSEELEADWRHAITAITVPMLQGAAVHTAIVAEEMADDDRAKT